MEALRMLRNKCSGRLSIRGQILRKSCAKRHERFEGLYGDAGKPKLFGVAALFEMRGTFHGFPRKSKYVKNASIGVVSLIASLALYTPWSIAEQNHIDPIDENHSHHAAHYEHHSDKRILIASTFRYSSIPKGYETRLMIIRPGTFGEEIEFDLVPVKSLREVKYNALSYQWIDGELTHSIFCDGRRKMIGANLYGALQRLRDPGVEKPVWIDYICIDQTNDDEKKDQIRKMTSIYSNAEQVIVWLGEESEHDNLAFEALEKLRDLPTRVMTAWLRLRDGGFWVGSRIDNYLRDIEHDHIIHLLRYRGWFHRTWILQEAGSGRNLSVYYSDKKMPWSVFEPAFNGTLSHTLAVRREDANAVQKSIDSITLIESVRKSLDAPYMSVFDVALAASANEYTLAEDKINAVLGLGKDWNQRKGLEPEYSTGAKAYKKFAIWDSTSNASLRILSCASGPQSTSASGLPSWVPDWTRLGNRHPFVRYSAETQFSVSGQIPPRISFSDDGNVLSVEGKSVDSIKKIGKIPDFTKITGLSQLDEEFLDGLQKTENWIQDVKKIASLGQKGTLTGERLTSVYRTLICGLTPEGHPASQPAYTKHLESYFEFRSRAPTYYRLHMEELQGAPRAFISMRHTEPNFAIYTLIDASIQKWSSKRRFCVTKAGRFACVPLEAEENDVICILFGANVPYVLRQKGEHYEVVGECYVDGIMHGEGLLDAMNAVKGFRLR
jgi:hypothetical protein